MNNQNELEESVISNFYCIIGGIASDTATFKEVSIKVNGGYKAFGDIEKLPLTYLDIVAIAMGKEYSKIVLMEDDTECCKKIHDITTESLRLFDEYRELIDTFLNLNHKEDKKILIDYFVSFYNNIIFMNIDSARQTNDFLKGVIETGTADYEKFKGTKENCLPYLIFNALVSDPSFKKGFMERLEELIYRANVFIEAGAGVVN